MFAVNVFPVCYFSDPWSWSLSERLKRLSKGDRRVAYFYERPGQCTFRYRVYNMIQALEASPNKTSASYFVIAELESMRSIVDLADVLVVCRSKYCSQIDQLIYTARSKGKRVYFDIDDLVFNTSYVDIVLNSLDLDTARSEVWDHWFAYIARLGATLRLCDAAIQRTVTLLKESASSLGRIRA